MSGSRSPAEILEHIQRSVADLQFLLRCGVCCSTWKDPIPAPCNHVFCKTCLEEWFHRQSTTGCPICRKTINRRGCKQVDFYSGVVSGYLQLARNMKRDMRELPMAVAPTAKQFLFMESQAMIANDDFTDSPMRNYRPEPQFALPKLRAKRRGPGPAKTFSLNPVKLNDISEETISPKVASSKSADGIPTPPRPPTFVVPAVPVPKRQPSEEIPSEPIPSPTPSSATTTVLPMPEAAVPNHSASYPASPTSRTSGASTVVVVPSEERGVQTIEAPSSSIFTQCDVPTMKSRSTQASQEELEPQQQKFDIREAILIYREKHANYSSTDLQVLLEILPDFEYIMKDCIFDVCDLLNLTEKRADLEIRSRRSQSQKKASQNVSQSQNKNSVSDQQSVMVKDEPVVNDVYEFDEDYLPDTQPVTQKPLSYSIQNQQEVKNVTEKKERKKESQAKSQLLLVADEDSQDDVVMGTPSGSGRSEETVDLSEEDRENIPENHEVEKKEEEEEDDVDSFDLTLHVGDTVKDTLPTQNEKVFNVADSQDVHGMVISVARIKTRQDDDLLQEWRMCFGYVRYESEITVDTTHLVMMNTVGRVCEERALMYTFAIANKREILCRDWLIECVKKKRIVDTAAFTEIGKNGTEPAWKRSRAATTPLFAGKKFYIPPKYADSTWVPRDKLKQLAELCGGIVETRIWEIQPEDSYIIFAPDSREKDAAKRMEMDTKAPVLNADWLMDSICEFRLVYPIDRYRVYRANPNSF